MLVRVCCGEGRVWSEVHVPTVAAEAARQVSRERTALTRERTRERTRLINQLRGRLATWGAALPRHRAPGWWTTVREWAGAALPGEVQARLARTAARVTLLTEHIAALEDQHRAAVTAAAPTSALQQLVQLKGIAATSASVLLDEGLVWRAFRNRRQVGGLLGLTPTPDNSGASTREQGISRAGNKRLQTISVQLAWGWIRWQPLSALTLWFREPPATAQEKVWQHGVWIETAQSLGAAPFRACSNRRRALGSRIPRLTPGPA
jgi:transposase